MLHAGPLNRAEWIKFLGLFFNKDAAATMSFDQTANTYNTTKANAPKKATPPVMAFVDLYTYPPDTAYEVSLAPYKVQYTQVTLTLFLHSSMAVVLTVLRIPACISASCTGFEPPGEKESHDQCMIAASHLNIRMTEGKNQRLGSAEALHWKVPNRGLSIQTRGADLSRIWQDAGAVAPNKTALLAINGTSLSTYDVTNNTVWFAWNRTTGGFPSKAAATAAFQNFLKGVRPFFKPRSSLRK